ncbi:hypothetical protein DERP_007655 [Dermatophagoides pteronyssinus]|uniref:Uncharacterized protein n=1 Tax=Dermatophagoides pteronyssinus TaxID=6956 RepID=A0ABQ8JKU9_DERPT|nr:hypothetical protein DERP_007655 [Dermatophagoides pteronyssinus]
MHTNNNNNVKSPLQFKVSKISDLTRMITEVIDFVHILISAKSLIYPHPYLEKRTGVIRYKNHDNSGGEDKNYN